jgi:two-component system, OmpR family, sensor histidine kinase BaeS
VRSLTFKLTLAFVLVGLMGAILVALLVGQSTRSEFDRFLSERDQAQIVAALGDFYQQHGSWSGVENDLANVAVLQNNADDIVLVDERGVVVLGSGRFRPGQRVQPRMLAGATPIEVHNQIVGALIPLQPNGRPGASRRPPDVQFLERVSWAAAISAGIATLVALVIGVLLARTLTRPLRELTAATQAMARGQLRQQVEVRSHDEIGTLAASFNQMSADLTRASQLRKQMTADLAHDLRTPLSILRGYTEGLQDGRLNGAPRVYRIMHGEVEHLQRLVEDLRVLSLADAGELPLNKRAVDPAAVLERTALAYVVAAEEQGVALRVEAQEGLPSILVDVDRMTQVLNNLVSNALRYTPAGGSVTLKAEGRTLNAEPKAEGPTANAEQAAADVPSHDLITTGTQAQTFSVQRSAFSVQKGVPRSAVIVLEVEDTGSGIDPADLPLIFERFYRADKARQRTESTSSGLGLAITKAIVDAHGGTISATSAPGKGTTFTITLPAAA